MKRASSNALDEENNAPMMAIFGGVFGLLLVFLVLVNLFSETALRERLEQAGEDGLYRIERLDGGAGYVVMAFPESLRIVESGVGIAGGKICESRSPFISYARRVYESDKQQLVFFILENGVSVMAEARNCLRSLWPGRVLTISWIIADNELLKSVGFNDIPNYIRDYAEEMQ